MEIRQRGIASQVTGMAAGVVTAWGAAPSADGAVLTATIAPTQDITKGVLAFTSGYSNRGFQAVGAISAGAELTITVEANDFEDFTQSYLFVGLYDDNGATGVTVSFLSDDAAAIIGNQTFDEVFADPDDNIRDVTEAEIFETFEFGLETTRSVDNKVDDLILSYFDGRFAEFFSPSFAVDFTQNSVLVNFSTGSFGGTITVPEPSGLALMLTLMGLGLVTRRRPTG